MLNEKKTSEELNLSNQKITPEDFWKIYVLCKSHWPNNVNGTEIPGGGTDKTEHRDSKNKNSFLNYSASHPDAVAEHMRSSMILHKYSDVSYISELEVRGRADGYFPLDYNP